MAGLNIRFKFLTAFFTCLISGHAFASDIRIGVLSIRGPEDAVKYWKQVADHLNTGLKGHHFIIVPHSYQSMDKAVADGQLEFAIVNPAEYIELEAKYGATPIATAISRVGPIESSYFGTVIFTKASRADIASLSDLKGKSLITASKTAFASWIVTRDELKRQGVPPDKLASVQFAGSSSDKVVMAVKNGEVDSGSVRTDVLEQMAQEGKISLTDFRILNKKHVEGFSSLLSSELYPEFAFVRLKQTDRQLANHVAAFLLLMPHNKPTIRYPNPIGWGIPESYEKVRKLLQVWKMPPYEDYGKVTLKESIRQHWYAVALAILFVMSLFLIIVLRLRMIQRQIKFRNLEIEKQNLADRNVQVMEQRDELSRKKAELEAALARVKLLEGIIPICSYCKKIRDDQNSWQQLEQYITSHSGAMFSHGICPHCFEEQMKVIKKLD